MSEKETVERLKAERVLSVAVLLEKLIEPLGAQHTLHDQTRHDSQVALGHEALEDITEGHDLSSRRGSQKGVLDDRSVLTQGQLPFRPPLSPMLPGQLSTSTLTLKGVPLRASTFKV